MWKHTHRDFRGTLDGVRTVLHLVPARGTCIVTLASLTDEELRAKLPARVAAASAKLPAPLRPDSADALARRRRTQAQ